MAKSLEKQRARGKRGQIRAMTRERSRRRRRPKSHTHSKGGGGRARKRLEKIEVYELPDSRTLLEAEWGEVPNTWHRPKDLPAAKQLAITAMRRHGVLVEACRASKIGRRVVYEMFKEDHAWKLAMVDAKRERLEEILRTMMERGTQYKGDLAGIYITKHEIPRYREVQRIELTGKDGNALWDNARDMLLERLTKLATAIPESVEVLPADGTTGLSLMPAKADRVKIRKAKDS